MANPSAARLRRKAKNSSRTQPPPPPPTSNLDSVEDERKVPHRLEVLNLAALKKPFSSDAALSASSLAPIPLSRKPTLTTSSKSVPLDKNMPPVRPLHLLIASVGNPAPYHNTRHSAGHILLKALTSHLNAPPLHKSREYGGLVTSTKAPSGTTWTFFQSPALMNVSGPAVLKAFKTFSSQHPRSEDEMSGLIILHDELELEPGKIKVKRGEGSAKGHNGIKSVQQSLQSAGLMGTLGARFAKVGVGIGRPVSRERDDVSGYVLGQLSGGEKIKIESAAEGLVDVLQQEVVRMGK